MVFYVVFHLAQLVFTLRERRFDLKQNKKYYYDLVVFRKPSMRYENFVFIVFCFVH